MSLRSVTIKIKIKLVDPPIHLRWLNFFGIEIAYPDQLSGCNGLTCPHLVSTFLKKNYE